MLSVNTKPKKRVRFSPDIIFEYNTTYTIDQDTTSLRVTCEEHQLESHLSFLEEENFNTLSLYEDFYDSYQYISEYGNFTVEQDIYMISHMDLASDKEIKIDMKSISIDTVTTSCDDNDFSTVAYPSRALPYYSPDTTAGLSLKKKFARDMYFKSRYVWCDPIGRSINWSRTSVMRGTSYKSFRLNRGSTGENSTKASFTDKRAKCMGCIVACRQQSDTVLSFSTDSGRIFLLKFPCADTVLDWFHLVRSFLSEDADDDTNAEI